MENIHSLLIIVLILILFLFLFFYIRTKAKEIEENISISKAFYLYGASTKSDDEKGIVQWLKLLYDSSKKYRKVFVIIDKQSSHEIRNIMVDLVGEEIPMFKNVIDFIIKLLSIRNPVRLATLMVQIATMQMQLISTIKHIQTLINQCKNKVFLTDFLIKKMGILHDLISALYNNNDILSVLDNSDKKTLKILFDSTKSMKDDTEEIKQLVSLLGDDISLKNIIQIIAQQDVNK